MCIYIYVGMYNRWNALLSHSQQKLRSGTTKDGTTSWVEEILQRPQDQRAVDQWPVFVNWEGGLSFREGLGILLKGFIGGCFHKSQRVQVWVWYIHRP